MREGWNNQFVGLFGFELGVHSKNIHRHPLHIKTFISISHSDTEPGEWLSSRNIQKIDVSTRIPPRDRTSQLNIHDAQSQAHPKIPQINQRVHQQKYKKCWKGHLTHRKKCLPYILVLCPIPTLWAICAPLCLVMYSSHTLLSESSSFPHHHDRALVGAGLSKNNKMAREVQHNNLPPSPLQKL